ncbi:MAG: preprotein translocase subunit SecE [Pyrinomonadaceae bacterium]|nr:preprotein translocase subunit SecE [Pyrinomonadaceae bacterium]
MSRQDEYTGANDDPAEFQPEGDARADSADALASGGAIVPPRSPRTGAGSRGGGERREGRSEGLIERISNFLRETRAEMRRVAWPTATEVKNTTIITIIAVIFFALYLYGVDHAWAFIITQIENLVSRLIGVV